MIKKNIIFIILATLCCTLIIISAVRYLPFLGILSFNGVADNNKDLISIEHKEEVLVEKVSNKNIELIEEQEVKNQENQNQKDDTVVTIHELSTGEQVKQVALADGPVVIKLYAPWCGACKVADKIMPDVIKECNGKVIFYSLNTTNQALVAAALEVGLLKEAPRSIPMFVSFDTARSIHDVHIGYMQKDVMNNYLKTLFSL